MNLNDMTVTELRKLAAQHNISGRSTMKKAELIAVVTRAEMDAKWDAAASEESTEQAKASDHNPDTTGQVAAVDLSALSILMDTKPQRVYSVPVTPERKDRDVIFERIEPGRAMADMYTNESGITRTGQVHREGKRWVLIDSTGPKTIRIAANTFNKLAKRWAKKAGVWAAEVRVENYV